MSGGKVLGHVLFAIRIAPRRRLMASQIATSKGVKRIAYIRLRFIRIYGNGFSLEH